jgi:predicted transposase/invertase (TIGR01784 family)
MLFVKFPDLLERFVAAILGIAPGAMAEFTITNPELPPESLETKFCHLDINMVVNGQRVNLEVQVADEGDYPERSLYYWAREYSSTLQAGNLYSTLPQVIIISIVDFRLFGCAEYHSKFLPLEADRHELLSDRMVMHYFEVRKLPRDVDVQNELELMLSLFRVKTEEELKQLEALEVHIVTKAIEAYREITGSREFKELERLRREALSNEAAALHHARYEAIRKNDKKWRGVVAAKDAEIAAAAADKDAAVAAKDAEIAAAAAAKDAEIADREAEIARLLALLDGKK